MKITFYHLHVCKQSYLSNNNLKYIVLDCCTYVQSREIQAILILIHNSSKSSTCIPPTNTEHPYYVSKFYVAVWS